MIEAVKRIEEVESQCTKVVDQVSQNWESLIDDDELEKVTEELRTTKTKVTQLKNEMTKLPLVENLAEATEMKSLQQQVTVLCKQPLQREDKFEQVHSEAEQITIIIQFIHQRVQREVEATMIVSSGLLSFDLLENLQKAQEDVK